MARRKGKSGRKKTSKIETKCETRIVHKNNFHVLKELRSNKTYVDEKLVDAGSEIISNDNINTEQPDANESKIFCAKNKSTDQELVDDTLTAQECELSPPSRRLRQRNPCIKAPLIQCEVCHLEFSCKYNLTRHMARFANRRFPCNRCGLKFSTKKQRAVHITDAHEQLERQTGSLSCPVCNQILRLTNRLQAHLYHYHDVGLPSVPSKPPAKTKKGWKPKKSFASRKNRSKNRARNRTKTSNQPVKPKYLESSAATQSVGNFTTLDKIDQVKSSTSNDSIFFGLSAKSIVQTDLEHKNVKISGENDWIEFPQDTETLEDSRYFRRESDIRVDGEKKPLETINTLKDKLEAPLSETNFTVIGQENERENPIEISQIGKEIETTENKTGVIDKPKNHANLLNLRSNARSDDIWRKCRKNSSEKYSCKETNSAKMANPGMPEHFKNKADEISRNKGEPGSAKLEARELENAKKIRVKFDNLDSVMSEDFVMKQDASKRMKPLLPGTTRERGKNSNKGSQNLLLNVTSMNLHQKSAEKKSLEFSQNCEESEKADNTPVMTDVVLNVNGKNDEEKSFNASRNCHPSEKTDDTQLTSNTNIHDKKDKKEKSVTVNDSFHDTSINSFIKKESSEIFHNFGEIPKTYHTQPNDTPSAHVFGKYDNRLMSLEIYQSFAEIANTDVSPVVEDTNFDVPASNIKVETSLEISDNCEENVYRGNISDLEIDDPTDVSESDQSEFVEALDDIFHETFDNNTKKHFHEERITTSVMNTDPSNNEETREKSDNPFNVKTEKIFATTEALDKVDSLLANIHIILPKIKKEHVTLSELSQNEKEIEKSHNSPFINDGTEIYVPAHLSGSNQSEIAETSADISHQTSAGDPKVFSHGNVNLVNIQNTESSENPGNTLKKTENRVNNKTEQPPSMISDMPDKIDVPSCETSIGSTQQNNKIAVSAESSKNRANFEETDNPPILDFSGIIEQQYETNRLEILQTPGGIENNDITDHMISDDADSDFSSRSFEPNLNDSGFDAIFHKTLESEAANYLEEASEFGRDNALRAKYACKHCYVSVTRLNVDHLPNLKSASLPTEIIQKSSHTLYLCALCPEVFLCEISMKEHVDHTHTVIPSLICNRLFPNRSAMRRHYRLRHFVGRYDKETCICGTNMYTRPALEDHFFKHCTATRLVKHHPLTAFKKCEPLEKMHVCNICGKDFWVKSCLDLHLLDCTNSKPAVTSNSESLVTSNLEPVVTSNSEPVMTLKSEPVETSNLEPDVTINSEPVMMLKSEPVETSNLEPDLTINSEPVMTLKSEPVEAPNFDVVVTSNLETVVMSNSEPVVTQNSEPIVTSNSESGVTLNFEPVAASNSEPVVTSNLEAAITSDSVPMKKTVSRKFGQGPIDRNERICRVCFVEFTDSNKLLMHEGIYASSEIHRCEVCDTIFPDKRLLHAHSRCTHTLSSGVRYVCYCTVCEQGFSKGIYRRVHMKHIHGETSSSATTVAPLIVDTSQTNVNKIMTDVDVPGGECNICKHVFANRKRFIEHAIYYKCDEIIRCTICDMDFHGQYSAHRHNKMTHYSDNMRNAYLYKCTICEEGFVYKAHLEAHVLHVHGETRKEKVIVVDAERDIEITSVSRIQINPSTSQIRTTRCYSCKTCEVNFPNLDLLVSHQMEYQNQGDYECPRCDKKCRTGSLLLDHLCLNHSTKIDGSVKCRICDEYFLTLSAWISHVKHFHTNDAVEPSEFYVETNAMSDKDFGIEDSKLVPSNSEILRGVTYKGIGDEIDGNNPEKVENSSGKASSKVGRKGKSKKIYPFEKLMCNVCEAYCRDPVELARHKALWSDEGPYMCEECGRRFTWMRFYQEHRIKHFRREMHDDRRYCVSCNEHFDTVQSLTMHKAHIHGKKSATRQPQAADVSLALELEGNQQISSPSKQINEAAGTTPFCSSSTNMYNEVEILPHPQEETVVKKESNCVPADETTEKAPTCSAMANLVNNKMVAPPRQHEETAKNGTNEGAPCSGVFANFGYNNTSSPSYPRIMIVNKVTNCEPNEKRKTRPASAISTIFGHNKMVVMPHPRVGMEANRVINSELGASTARTQSSGAPAILPYNKIAGSSHPLGVSRVKKVTNHEISKSITTVLPDGNPAIRVYNKTMALPRPCDVKILEKKASTEVNPSTATMPSHDVSANSRYNKLKPCPPGEPNVANEVTKRNKNPPIIVAPSRGGQVIPKCNKTTLSPHSRREQNAKNKAPNRGRTKWTVNRLKNYLMRDYRYHDLVAMADSTIAHSMVEVRKIRLKRKAVDTITIDDESPINTLNNFAPKKQITAANTSRTSINEPEGTRKKQIPTVLKRFHVANKANPQTITPKSSMKIIDVNKTFRVTDPIRLSRLSFKCELCNLSFKTEDSRNLHIGSAHPVTSVPPVVDISDDSKGATERGAIKIIVVDQANNIVSNCVIPSALEESVVSQLSSDSTKILPINEVLSTTVESPDSASSLLEQSSRGVTCEACNIVFVNANLLKLHQACFHDSSAASKIQPNDDVMITNQILPTTAEPKKSLEGLQSLVNSLPVYSNSPNDIATIEQHQSNFGFEPVMIPISPGQSENLGEEPVEVLGDASNVPSSSGSNASETSLCEMSVAGESTSSPVVGALKVRSFAGIMQNLRKNTVFKRRSVPADIIEPAEKKPKESVYDPIAFDELCRQHNVKPSSETSKTEVPLVTLM